VFAFAAPGSRLGTRLGIDKVLVLVVLVLVGVLPSRKDGTPGSSTTIGSVGIIGDPGSVWLANIAKVIQGETSMDTYLGLLFCICKYDA
jgi:hypothetical protein